MGDSKCVEAFAPVKSKARAAPVEFLMRNDLALYPHGVIGRFAAVPELVYGSHLKCVESFALLWVRLPPAA